MDLTVFLYMNIAGLINNLLFPRLLLLSLAHSNFLPIPLSNLLLLSRNASWASHERFIWTFVPQP
jgi:hypothetical protein